MIPDRDPSVIKRDASLLAAGDPNLGRAAAVAGDFPLRLRDPGFDALIWLILGQQVSIAAARVMYARLAGRLGAVTPTALLELDDETMRSCGFTRHKTGYARSLAEKLEAGETSLDAIATMPDSEAVAALTSLRGIGRWTAENYLIWALGRRDVFPADDLALRVGWQRLSASDAPLRAAQLRDGAARWAPRRTAAAFLIWHYYVGVGP